VKIEGLFDYFDIEDYMTAIDTANTIGRYVIIYPSEFMNDPAGRKSMSFSQIQVFDMNGNNIALGKQVTATSRKSGSAAVFTTVDGNTTLRGGSNVWQSDPTEGINANLTLDLGSLHQIARVSIIGRSDTNNSNLKGIRVFVVDTPASIINCDTNGKCHHASFETSDSQQTITFPNAINQTPGPVDPSNSAPLNADIIPTTNSQPEVFLVGPEVAGSAAAGVCTNMGARLATTGQLSYAALKGASWSAYGWVANSNSPYKIVGSSIKDNSILASTVVPSTAMVNCFGIKPNAGTSSNVSTPFNDSIHLWSEYYMGRAMQTFGTKDTITVPDIQVLKDNIIMDVDTDFSTIDQDYITVSKLLPEEWRQGDSQITQNFYTMLRENAVYNFARDMNKSTNPTEYFDITVMNTGVTVFGTISAQARSDMEASLKICQKIFVGSPDDVEKFINVQYDLSGGSVFTPTFRNSPGYDTYCKSEVDLSGFNVSTHGSNVKNCSTKITPTVLALIPDPTRNFIINWIYNRTQLFINKQEYYIENPQFVDPITRTGSSPKRPLLTQITAAQTDMNNKLSALKQLKADVNIDVTNQTILNNIAQSFYEALGGNYIMSNIYDVFTIGNTILDIRFDLTKHGDIGPFQDQIAALTDKYNAIRNSNLAQDVLDKAKSDYQDALATIQSKETNNTYQPILGVVGRFFYTYDPTSAAFNITGFTLNAKAVTSFIPELNGGTQVSIGSDIGNLNFTPTIKYTLNVPELLDCTNPITLRRIMDDYVDATVSDLALALYNANPSMDTSAGTIHVKQIIGAVQVSPTQCAITWKESLWDDDNNEAIKSATRSALISYTVDQEDWYSSQITFDPTGFIFFSNNTVPSCSFDPTEYKKKVSPRLDSASASNIITDFLQSTFNNGYAPICPKTLPNYLFNPIDYVAASSDLKSAFTNQTSGILNTTAAFNHYAARGPFTNTGIYESRSVRASQTITALATPINIQQPFPGATDLDNANNVCPTSNCEDFDTLYSIVNQYNSDPTSPGTILRVTKAYTPNQYQCDIEADVDYDIQVPNSKGTKVQKGSFTIAAGIEKPATDMPPTGIKKRTTLALNVHMDIKSCKIQYDSFNGDGSSIQSNTPSLPKPMEYSTEFQKRQNSALNTSFGNIATSVENSMTVAKSTLPAYKANTLTAQQKIATLGKNCNTTCDLTANVNSMLQFYKDQNKKNRIIDSVLHVKTLDSSTCEMTFTGLTPLPLNEVFGVKGPLSRSSGKAKCAYYGATLATYDQVVAAQAAGGGWCSWGWIADDASHTSQVAFPVQPTDRCANDAPGVKVRLQDWSGEYGANCYGVKPALTNDILPFSDNKWNQPTQPEVFAISGYNYTQINAQAKCASYGATLATYDQVVAARAAGAGWCSWGWIKDDSQKIAQISCPLQPSSDCWNGSPIWLTAGGSRTWGANCYGEKPRDGTYNDVMPFTSGVWNKPIYTAQTNAVQFTMSSTENCTFTPTSITPVIPSIPDDMPFATPNWSSTPQPEYTAQSYTAKEVFAMKGDLTQADAQAKCASYGATLATYDQVVAARAAGAGWCSWGWIADDASRTSQVAFPVQDTNPCHSFLPGITVGVMAWSGTYGANCYGVKPAITVTTDILPFSPTKWSQSLTTMPYANPYKETFANYNPIQVRESTFPLNKSSFGIDIARNNDGPGLDTLFVEPLRQESRAITVGPKYVDVDETLKGERASSYKYIRFRPTKTRDPSSPVNLAKVRFFLKKNEVDLRAAKVTNPMGTWVGDVADVNGPGYTRGWSDKHKRALVFAFPYALMMDGFSWTTADPDKGIGGDPVQWKLEGSTNGTYWTTLRDQSHNYPVPVDRFQDLPVFRF